LSLAETIEKLSNNDKKQIFVAIVFRLFIYLKDISKFYKSKV